MECAVPSTPGLRRENDTQRATTTFITETAFAGISIASYDK